MAGVALFKKIMFFLSACIIAFVIFADFHEPFSPHRGSGLGVNAYHIYPFVFFLAVSSFCACCVRRRTVLAKLGNYWMEKVYCSLDLASIFKEEYS